MGDEPVVIDPQDVWHLREALEHYLRNARGDAPNGFSNATITWCENMLDSLG